MPLEDRKQITNTIQNVILENREKLTISGVLDVLSFDDQIVIVETELGLLTVKGENLRINKLSLDTTEVIVEGKIYNLGYSEKSLEKKSSGSFQVMEAIYAKSSILLFNLYFEWNSYRFIIWYI